MLKNCTHAYEGTSNQVTHAQPQGVGTCISASGKIFVEKPRFHLIDCLTPEDLALNNFYLLIKASTLQTIHLQIDSLCVLFYSENIRKNYMYSCLVLANLKMKHILGNYRKVQVQVKQDRLKLILGKPDSALNP